MVLTELVVYLALRTICISSTNECFPIVANDKLTIRGNYEVENVIYDPIFTRPNVRQDAIGTRAITFKGTNIAIHGWYTYLNFSSMESHGCIRLNNSDVEYITDNFVFEKITIK